MAFLAPLAAGASTAAPALAATTAATTGATAALGTGLSAGTILGTGAASSGILGSLGLNALGGMTSILPAAASAPALAAPALASQGLVAAATPGIFSTATPALAGLKSLATPGLLQTAGMSPLGGLASLVPAGTTVPGAAGFKSLAMANAPLTTNPASWNLVNQAAGLGDIAAKTASLRPDIVKIADVAAKTGPDLSKSLLQQGANFKAAPQLSRADLLAKQAGQIPKTAEAANLAQQADIGQRVIDFQTAQKMAARSGVVSPIEPGQNFMSNAMNLFQNPSVDAAIDYAKEHPYATAAGAYGLYSLMQPKYKAPQEDKGMIRPYEYSIEQRPEAYAAAPGDSSEQRYFDTRMKELPSYTAKKGGIMLLANGGPVEQMAELNTVGANTGYPMAHINSPFYANPTMQRPEAVNTLFPSSDAAVGTYTGEAKFAEGGEAETTGEYKYSYDPNTMQFTQLAAPKYAAPTGRHFNPQNGLLVGQNAGSWSGPRLGPAMGKMPESQTSIPPVGTVTGGIAQPVIQPAAVFSQPAYTPLATSAYQSPEQRLGLTNFYAMMDERLKEQAGGYAKGGGISALSAQSNLGDYSDGGRLLKGPGDGVSDSIPASIGNRRPARLADGEFVVPARIVSELGNGSTEAGARKLYAMMDRVQKARSKTVGKKKVAVNSRADKHLPA